MTSTGWRQPVRIAFWTFVNPLRVHRAIETTGTARTTVATWCTLAAALGLCFAAALPGPPTPGLLLVLAAAGALLMLVGAADLRSAGFDSLGILALAIIAMLAACPHLPEHRPIWPWQQQVLFIIPFLLGAAATFSSSVWLVNAAANRSFLFVPIGLGFFVGLSFVPGGPWILGPLSAVTGPAPEGTPAAILLLLLFALSACSPQVSIRSFRHQAGTENAAALIVVTLKRRLAVVFGGLSLVCLIAAWFRPELGWLAAAFLIAALLQLDLPQTVATSLWLVRQNGRSSFRGLREGKPPLFLEIPCCPLEPPGLRRYLKGVRETRGDRSAAELALEILLRTGYRRAGEAMLGAIQDDNPSLGFEISRRLSAAWPSEPKSDEARTPRSAAAAQRPVLIIPQLAPRDFAETAFRDRLFWHHYEAPRGKEGAPLAAWPLWFPVAAPPLETMTLPQIVYRALASVREPFRRTRLLMSDPGLARGTYTELLSWAADWAASSLGASLIPIALSLRKLTEQAPRLAELCAELQRERAEALAEGEPGRPVRSGCSEILAAGSAVPAADVSVLAAAVEAGNAWILIEDDREDGAVKADLKTVRQAFDLVFGEAAGLSHVALLVVTARKECHVLSDIQTFHVDEPRKAETPPAEAGPVPGRLTAALCRTLAFWGSPPMKTALIASGLVAAALLAVTVLSYETVARWAAVINQRPAGTPKPELLVLGIPFLLPLFAMFIGYKWGLFHGSEEIRQGAVENLMSSLIASAALLLLLLPAGMKAGLLKTFCVTLAALPGTVLLGISLTMLTSLIADVSWLLLSTRLARRATTADLARWSERYRIILHVALEKAALPLPARSGAREPLPLLLSFRNLALVPRVLEAFPEAVDGFRRTILRGLKRGDPNGFTYASSSLLVEALCQDAASTSARCLERVSRDCVAQWPLREEYDQYHEPSTTFTMNALEYLARRLCHLNNLEELIVVR